MSKLLLKLTLLVFALSFSLSNAAWAKSVAEILLIQGDVLVDRAGLREPAVRLDQLTIGDRILTMADSRVLIRFVDSTRVWLAEGSDFEIKRFDAGASQPEARFGLLKGAMRTVTGLITKRDNATFEIETNVATMGVRGTDFWGGFLTPDTLDVTLFEGANVYVTNALGSVLLTSPGDGTSVQMGQAPTTVKSWMQSKIDKAIRATQIDP